MLCHESQTLTSALQMACESRSTGPNPVGDIAGHYGLLAFRIVRISSNQQLMRSVVVWAEKSIEQKVTRYDDVRLAVMVLSSKHYSIKTTSGLLAFPPLPATQLSVDDPMDCYTGPMVIRSATLTKSRILSRTDPRAGEPQRWYRYHWPIISETLPSRRRELREHRPDRQGGTYLIFMRDYRASADKYPHHAPQPSSGLAGSTSLQCPLQIRRR